MSSRGTRRLSRSTWALASVLIVATFLVLAQTMGPASAAQRNASRGHQSGRSPVSSAGHHNGGGHGGPTRTRLTAQITRHSPERGSRGGQGSRDGKHGNSGKGNDGNRGNGRDGGCHGGLCRNAHVEVASIRGGELPAIASPITLPASTVPTTTVPRTTPTTKPPTTTTPPTTVPRTTPTVPTTVTGGSPPPPPKTPSTTAAGTNTSPALGATASISGVATLQASNRPAPSTTAAATKAKGKSATKASSGSGATTIGGYSDVPMELPTGGGPFLSLQIATNLKVPILFGVAVALFVLGQALIDRRDPKMSRAPERNDDDTVGFE
jgi:hypothetical protein